MSLDAMKQALEALEHEAQKGNDDAYRVERDALRAAIEQAQKPVGWFGYDEKISTWFETNEGEDDSVPLYAGARGWEGLTPEEIVGIELSLRKYHDGDRYDLSLSDFARAIEANLKEKNT
jgi:hypothetical protein